MLVKAGSFLGILTSNGLSLNRPHISQSISLISYLATKDLMESQEEVKEEGLGYVVMKNLFSRDSEYQLKLVKKSHSTTIRESAEKLSLTKKVIHLNVFCTQIF